MVDLIILSSIGIEGRDIEKLHVLEDCETSITIEIKLRITDQDVCPQCGCMDLKIKDYSYKRYEFYGLVTKTINVVFDHKRLRCDCGKTFMQHNPFLCNNHGYKVTNAIKNKVIELLSNTISASDVGNLVGISHQTVLNIINETNPQSGEIGSVLCIDEFSYRRVRGKTKYGCILINGDNNTLIDVLPNRKETTIVDFLKEIRKNNDNVEIKYVCMDMYEPYKRAVKTFNKNIIVIVDKFHFIKRLNKVIDSVRIRIMKTYDADSFEYWLLKKYNKMLLRKELDSKFHKIKIKFNKMRFKLYEKQIVDKMLAMNNDLKTVYQKIHHWVANYQNWDEITAEIELNKLINFIHYKDYIPELKSLRPTLISWKEEIINIFRSFGEKKLTNAISESKIRKIKDLKRTLRGFNSFRTFRARIFLIFNKVDPVKFGEK